MERYDALIIGAGPAGLTAAIYLRRANKTVAVFERLAVGGQLAATPVVENYPGAAFNDGFSIAQRMKSQAEDFGAKLIMDEVVSADLKNLTVSTKSLVYGGASIIIATGALSQKLGLEREEELTGAGVSYCAVCDGRFHKDGVVVLAGNTWRAKHDLAYLAGICKKIYYVTPSVYDGDSYDNVEVLNGAMPAELKGTPLKSVVVRFNDGGERELECGALFVDIGFMPQSLLFKGQLDTDDNGYILTDENMATSAEGVFAAGDVRKKTLRQVVTAAADGAIAASGASKFIAKSARRLRG